MRIIFFLLFFLSIGSPLYCMGEPEAKITVQVVDDKGQLIKNATVKNSFRVLRTANPWNGQKSLRKEGVTDEKGFFSASSITIGRVGVSAIKDKYYKSYKTFNFKSVKLGKWQPWNPTIKLVLRERINPIPMYAKRLFNIKIPKNKNKFAYDFLIGDWVEPFGKGKIKDIVFEVENKPEKTVEGEYGEETLYDERIAFSFPNNGDGAVEHPVILDKHGRYFSELRLPGQTPEKGYKSKFEKRIYKEQTGKPSKSNFRQDMNYFIRIRTKKDADGKITSALYGKIYNDFGDTCNGFTFDIIYYINPTPNDRNVEFDPKKNLFTPTRGDEVRKP